MFQRISDLLFGAAEDVSAEVSGPKPCVTEADEEGWLLVSVPDGGCTSLGEDSPSFPPSLPHGEPCGAGSEHGAAPPASRALDPAHSSRRRRPLPPQSSHARSSRSPLECAGGLEESWFIAPPPCFTAEGAAAEAGPMENLLIEHPSMSVYVSSSKLEQSDAADGAGTVSRMSESVPSPLPTRLARGPACQAASLAKVTHASRIQRARSRAERRHLTRGRVQRQNRARQQVPRHAAHTRSSFLHQPCQRGLCH